MYYLQIDYNENSLLCCFLTCYCSSFLVMEDIYKIIIYIFLLFLTIESCWIRKKGKPAI